MKGSSFDWVEKIVGNRENAGYLSFSNSVFKSLLFFRVVVLHGSVIKCLTRNPGVLDFSSTGSSRFFARVSLGKTLQSPGSVLTKFRKDMNNVSHHHDIPEILLKVV